DLPRNADRRRGRFAPGRLHRGPRRSLAGRGGDQRQPERPDFAGAAHADAARVEGNQDALWSRRRKRAHARRSRPVVRGYARTYPADRGEGAAEVAASIEVAEAAGVYGWS